MKTGYADRALESNQFIDFKPRHDGRAKMFGLSGPETWAAAGSVDIGLS
jgi:hypothetical protein